MRPISPIRTGKPAPMCRSASVLEVIDEITARYHHDVAVVTHGGVIMVMISACLGLGLEKRFRFTSPANCSISTLVYDFGRAGASKFIRSMTQHILSRVSVKRLVSGSVGSSNPCQRRPLRLKP